LFTEKGLAFCQKTDIFKELLWFSYKDEPSNWHVLNKEQVKEILEKNKNKEKVPSLEVYAVEQQLDEEKVVFENVVGQDSLTRFDKPKGKRNRNRKKSRNKNTDRNKNNQNQAKNNNRKRSKRNA
jgi:hypothetical protein